MKQETTIFRNIKARARGGLYVHVKYLKFQFASVRIYIDKLCQIFFIFMQFAGAFTQIIGCRSPLGNPGSATVYDNFLLCFFPSLQFRW